MSFQNKFGPSASASTGFGIANSVSSAPFSFNAVTTSAGTAFGAFGNTTESPRTWAAVTYWCFNCNLGFGGGFGTQHANPTPGFGLAANPQTSTQFGFAAGSFSQPSMSSTSNFGATAQSPAFGQFGLSQQATSKPLTFGGFGAGTQTTQTSLFGLSGGTQSAPSNIGLFGTGGVGQQPTSNAFGSIFGVGSQSTASIGGNLGRSMLPVASTAAGNSNIGMSSSSNQVGSTITSQSQTSQQLTPYEELSRLISAWTPESIDCRFQSYFYNMVHPAEVQFYTPPPSILVPVRVCGFEDIKKRLAVQEEEYGAKLEDMKRKHNLETLVRIEDRKRKHIELTQRVIKLMRRIQVLRLSGTLIRSDEEVLKGRLEDIKQQLQRSSRKLETLKTQYNVTKLQWGVREPPVTHKFNAVNDNQLENIIKVLDTEQTGIVHDIETLKKDSKDIDVIIRHLNDVP
ncbi:5677_t:CDS:2 [Cetraspora pellucida]|uniref:5677_t:CDS:1 n=1 Tax=Cetraspora pellucida TaxID=1433469 RepID=A0ACA9LXH5_9GLOM|nr:5677_t:CDS:2 [Cetraspora pellucida]